MEKIYFPIKSLRPDKKYFVITASGKKVHFGAKGYEDFTMHKDEERKANYIKRHQRNHENWNDPDTAGFWSRWLLWNKPTLEASYKDIQKRFLK